jgi:1-acyl-sn-glycerol-3-phosphate acyltransferase
MWSHPEVFERAERLELPFNRYGLDPYGVSIDHVSAFLSFLRPFYKTYFRVETHGLEHVPSHTRAMLVGNHSGGIPVDGAMVLSSMFFELEPPRLVHGMVDKFVGSWPVVSNWFNRVGQVTGLPEHAIRLLRDDRMLMVFPEGAEGTAKLYRDRYELLEFGTGFMRLALEADAPIVPFAFLGGGEALPTIARLERLGRMLGAPYVPIPPYLLPVPLPVRCDVYYGEPMEFEGDGSEADETIQHYIDQVKARIAKLIERGRAERRQRSIEDEPQSHLSN